MPDFTPTPGQAMAISDRGGELLVSAAAGSGKTRVLIERLMGYILDPERPVDVDSFLVITFTRAAAEQLRAKIGETLAALAAGPGADAARLRRQRALLRRAQICTIDSFCVALLRENASRLGIDPGFAIADEQRAAELREQALEAVLERAYERAEPGFMALAGSVGAGRDDSRLEALLLELHARLQAHSRPEQWARGQQRGFDRLPDDAADTPWGRELLDGARAELLYWRGEFERMLDEASCSQAAMSAYGESLSATLDGLRAAADAAGTGWDALCAALPIEFPRLKPLKSEPELRELVKNRRGACRDALKRLGKGFAETSAPLLEDVSATAGAMDALLDLALDFDREFAERKRRRSLMDFADAEHLAARLLTDGDGRPTEFALELSRRYTEVMIDEYQDVSRVQEEIVSAVSGGGRKLFMVGDVKQSIYRFRLADPGIFLEKYGRFADAPAPEGEPRRVFLRESFRSRPEVVAAVNSVFGCLMSRELGELDYDENARLIAALPYPGEVGKPELWLFPSPAPDDEGEGERPDKYAFEARCAAARIRALVEGGAAITAPGGERPLGYGDVCVLLRSANVVGPIWRREFEREGIPVEAGRAGGFFEAPEVEVTLSLLSIIDNPRQDVQLVSVLRSALFGFTPDELTAIRLADRDAELYDALCLRAEEDEKCSRFIGVLRELRSLSRESELTALLAALYEKLDCFAVCAALSDGAQRAARLRRLFELAREFESGAWRGLRRFNEWIERMRADGGEPSMPNASAGGAVQIMSVHQSKGLEFPVVVLGDTARAFNDMDRRATVLVHPELGLGPKLTDRERGVEYPTIARRAVEHRLRREQLSEELRLLYVAMTRARERLIMTGCVKDPDKLLAKLEPVAAPRAHSTALLAMNNLCSWLATAALADGGRSLELCLGVPEGGPRAAARREPGADAPQPEEVGAPPSLAERFAWRYAYGGAVELPSKVTATELKSLPQADPESAELLEPAPRSFRMPQLAQQRAALSASERGTAAHLALRYLDLEALTDMDAAREAVDALALTGRLSRREAAAVNAGDVLALAKSGLGRRICASERVWREFAFSLLRPACELYPGAGGDEILLQGVVDCCFVEDGALVVVDYKTDRVSAGAAAARAENYRRQLEAYAWAMSRITGLETRERIVYFLTARCAVRL